MLDMDFSVLDLPTRVQNPLREFLKVNCLRDLTFLSERQILRTPNMGKMALAQIKNALGLRGLRLGVVRPSPELVNLTSAMEILRRACMPEVLLPADVAVTLQVEEPEARRMLQAGELGTTFRVGGTLGVLRSVFMAVLKRRGKGA